MTKRWEAKGVRELALDLLTERDAALAENARLATQLKIATDMLTTIARCGCSACGPATLIDLAHARVLADDALIQISVVGAP